MAWARAVRPTAYDVQAVLLWHCCFTFDAEWYWAAGFFLLDAAGRLGRRWGMNKAKRLLRAVGLAAAIFCAFGSLLLPLLVTTLFGDVAGICMFCLQIFAVTTAVAWRSSYAKGEW